MEIEEKWKRITFEDTGTEMVQTDNRNNSYYYVYGIKDIKKYGLSKIKAETLKSFIAIELTTWLNTGKIPKWIKGAEREVEKDREGNDIDRLLLKNGIKIIAGGPLIDTDPPYQKLVQKPHTKKLRKALIDNLLKAA